MVLKSRLNVCGTPETSVRCWRKRAVLVWYITRVPRTMRGGRADVPTLNNGVTSRKFARDTKYIAPRVPLPRSSDLIWRRARGDNEQSVISTTVLKTWKSQKSKASSHNKETKHNTIKKYVNKNNITSRSKLWTL